MDRAQQPQRQIDFAQIGGGDREFGRAAFLLGFPEAGELLLDRVQEQGAGFRLTADPQERLHHQPEFPGAVVGLRVFLSFRRQGGGKVLVAAPCGDLGDVGQIVDPGRAVGDAPGDLKRRIGLAGQRQRSCDEQVLLLGIAAGGGRAAPQGADEGCYDFPRLVGRTVEVVGDGE